MTEKNETSERDNNTKTNGTTYDSSYTDKTYARVDTVETPGYFTYKAKAA